MATISVTLTTYLRVEPTHADSPALLCQHPPTHNPIDHAHYPVPAS